jgi:hypothetical protein
MSTPRFRQVPEDWKHPLGPYRQAPAEYGGEWWLVNPFTTDEPWVTQSVIVERELPPGLVEVFGLRPRISDYSQATNAAFLWRVAVD